ncbi:hypothetical protein EDB83DRAFT_2548686 [Lactarius deliciosus]|nr:hypothetical protein EDB83DRAFT_2548686 [Lactarius deliciosus]
MTWETRARAPPPRPLDNDDDDDEGFCDGDTFLLFPGPRTLDGNDGDGTTHPHRHLSSASPMMMTTMTGTANLRRRAIPPPALAPRTLGDYSININGTTHYPFAPPTAATTQAAAEGTSHQFQLCALQRCHVFLTDTEDKANLFRQKLTEIPEKMEIHAYSAFVNIEELDSIVTKERVEELDDDMEQARQRTDTRMQE